MQVDKFGQIILSEQDLCELYLSRERVSTLSAISEKPINFDSELELNNVPELTVWTDQNLTVDQFDEQCQQQWNMPEHYQNLDIAKWLLDCCENDEQRQRVGKELLLYLDRNLFTLLKYLKYLVDTMRKHNIVWGVGRGSSVSSYVLFLIGVHKIDSIYYDLPIEEFLR